ncbi:MAG TPA: hypothetical protein VGD65_25715 [Chryseosolibacter sp.]
MNTNHYGFVDFLREIRNRNYDKHFASFHSSNLMMQEGVIDYDVQLDDNLIVVVLDFFVKLDTDFVDEASFQRLIDDLIEMFGREVKPEKIEIIYVLNRKSINLLYKKYEDNKISFESLKSALRKYYSRQNDFETLIELVRNR